MQSFAEFQRITRELLDEMRAKGWTTVCLLALRSEATLQLHAFTPDWHDEACPSTQGPAAYT